MIHERHESIWPVLSFHFPQLLNTCRNKSPSCVIFFKANQLVLIFSYDDVAYRKKFRSYQLIRRLSTELSKQAIQKTRWTRRRAGKSIFSIKPMIGPMFFEQRTNHCTRKFERRARTPSQCPIKKNPTFFLDSSLSVYIIGGSKRDLSRSTARRFGKSSDKFTKFLRMIAGP
jgi:hypothetical protein